MNSSKTIESFVKILMKQIYNMIMIYIMYIIMIMILEIG
jgi:hypothetical protein